MYNLKVTIIGAGIGGLTTGIALKNIGYDVEIYERTRELRPAGAGISLWSNGIKVLNRLGLGEKVAAIGGEMNRMEYRSHTDEQLSAIDLRPLVDRVGERPYPVARTDLQQMLRDAFGKDKLHLGCKCVGVEQDETSATAIFEDGDRVKSDLIISADGIHSTIREYVTGEVTPRFADYVNWNGLVAASDDLCEADNWVIYVGEGKRASMMPVGDNRFYFFFGCPMKQGTVVEPEDRQKELKDIFAGWPQAVRNLIDRLNPLETNRLEIADLDPLDTLVKGRVALLGDAGHATTPTLGQGGCQAIEDAEILSRYLVSTNISVSDALKRYEQARKDRVSQLVLKARQRTDTIYGKDENVTAAWYKQLEQESESNVIDALAKVILGGPLQ
ncbi:FAD-dependent urate hydroxylase HpxO [Dactylococcopsis salina]|uniref:FAD-dependent urate hydroxylase n=1 Tax=Dactylococcopsis salina (strain PCC 8305) TaxID=13035 RepID=K9YQL0_DACS8|nr:FAD-dependent urate hydroxylase HpxO [Dactylococcopsis salina]AFZ49196.1 2-polyprenyl-6-methoxyphenol hydroxylase-like oxidoreductase [Dactylococcopsis salina PCC 8305]